MKKSIYLIILLLLFSNCKKIIEVDFPKLEPKIVVNSLFRPDSIFTVNISRSSNFNDSNVYFLDDATCKLYANDKFLFNFVYLDRGFYSAPDNYKPIAGINYRIEVSHPKLPTVWAENSIPTYLPQTNSFQIQDSAVYDANETNFFLSKLNFNFIDQANISNFYEISLTARSDSISLQNDTIITNWGDTIVNIFNFESWTYALYVKGNDPVILNENLLDYYPQSFPFSDIQITNNYNFEILFDQLTYRTTIIDKTTFEYVDFYAPIYYTLFVKLRSVSDAYYNYRKKLILHTNNQEGDIWTGTGSPVQMYSNVHNGYGIFAGYQEVVDSARNY